MNTATTSDVENIAKNLNLKAVVTSKGGKPFWTFTSPNGKVAVIMGNTCACSALELMADLAGNKPEDVTDENIMPKVNEKVFANPKATTRTMMITVDHPDFTLDQVHAEVTAEGFKISKNVASVTFYDARKTLAYIMNRSKVKAFFGR